MNSLEIASVREKIYQSIRDAETDAGAKAGIQKELTRVEKIREILEKFN
jgi:hypothetical protein